MTDRETLAGLDDIAEDSGTLGMNLYGYADGTMKTLSSSADLGQGPGAVAWLTGDFFGGNHNGIAQLWDNNGRLGMNIYLEEPFGVGLVFSLADLGQGSGAVAWLAGDFTHSGQTEIAQLWDNNGRLGLNVYRVALGDTVQTIPTSDLGQGPGAVAWLTGDFTGSGETEIAQLWDNNGRLGLNVYLSGIFGSFTEFSSADLGQGSGALAWLTGDFTGSGQTEIAQLWDNDGKLGLNVYGISGNTVTAVFHSADMGQGSGALAWLADTLTGSSLTVIAQPWAS